MLLCVCEGLESRTRDMSHDGSMSLAVRPEQGGEVEVLDRYADTMVSATVS